MAVGSPFLWTPDIPQIVAKSVAIQQLNFSSAGFRVASVPEPSSFAWALMAVTAMY